MTTEPDPLASPPRQKVPSPQAVLRAVASSTAVGDVYLKLTVIDDVLVVSFKELRP